MTDLLRGTRSPWIASPFVALATLLGLHGLTGMVVWGESVITAATLLAVVTVAVAVTRIATRSRLLPTVVGAAVSILASIPAFARGPEGQVRYVPTPTALRELAAAVGDGVHEAATSVAPVEVTTPLLAALMAGVFAVFLLAEHLAVSWRAAAVSGLILLAPWMPAIALQHRVSVRLLLAAIGCWVITLALTKRPTGVHTRPTPLPTVVATAATLALVALVAPTALGAHGWGLIPRLSTPDQFDGTTRLNLALDLRNSLTARSSSTVLVYVSTGERPDAFRQYTLSDFDGTSWVPSTGATDGQDLSGVLWPTPVDDWGVRPIDRVEVEVVDAAERNLALPPVPRTVDLAGPWTYSPSLDEVSSTSETTLGLRYAFEGDMHYFSAENLRALGDASGADAAIGAQYLALPEDADVARFVTLGEELTANATTRYDKALALQEFFRDTSVFRYDTSVQPTGSDSVSVFLDDEAGFCVHFATAFAIIARSLGIPSRIAVGFLPGVQAENGASVVRGGDAHTWPEVYFEGAGWVRFEPTPASQSGARPSYASPENATNPTAEPVIPVPSANPTAEPVEPVTPTTALPSPDAIPTSEQLPWRTIAVVVVLIGIAAAVGAWWSRRRREFAEAALTPDGMWEALRRRLPQSVTWNTTHTPTEAVDHVAGAMAAQDAPLGALASGSFRTLASAVSDHRYAPEGTDVRSDVIASMVDDVATAVEAAISESAKSRRVPDAGRGGSRRGA